MGEPVARGKGSGYMVDRAYQQPSPPLCSSNRPGLRRSGVRDAADPRRGRERSRPLASGAEGDRAVSGQTSPNASRVSISGLVRVPGLAEPDAGPAPARAACPACGPEGGAAPRQDARPGADRGAPQPLAERPAAAAA